jgi:anti-anti-sigma factor
MNVETTTEPNGRAVMKLHGRFEFATHRVFRKSAKLAMENPRVREIEVDLGAVDYIDSSALGLLLLLRSNATASGKSVSLSHASGHVKQILDIAAFDKLFSLK